LPRELDPIQTIERGILKTHRRALWDPFFGAVRRYELIGAGDRIAVCVSGGKDSMLLAKLMQLLQRQSELPFELVFLAMDPGYGAEDRRRLEENAARLGVPLTVFETDVFHAAGRGEKYPCYRCARMRRGHLYAKAKELGCNKIALGHHRNDVIETTVMGLFYSGQLRAMPPKLHSRNFEGMELIRPLYCMREDDILAWARRTGLPFLQCACRFTQRLAAGETGATSKRQEVKELLRELRRDNPTIEENIFSALHAVSIETFPGYRAGGERHSFLKDYDARTPKQPPIKTP